MIPVFEYDRDMAGKFQVFMTKTLLAESKKACARSLQRLALGAAKNAKRIFAGQDWARDLVAPGIDYSPKKARRIESLEPMRVHVGVVGRRQDRKRALDPPVGKPFIVHKLDSPLTGEKRGKFVLRRFGPKRGENWLKYRRQRLNLVIGASNEDLYAKRFRFMLQFRAVVRHYVEENHDRIAQLEFQKAIDRAAK
jgi:hypothetical protein